MSLHQLCTQFKTAAVYSNLIFEIEEVFLTDRSTNSLQIKVAKSYFCVTTFYHITTLIYNVI